MTTECDKQVIVGNSIGILGNDGGSCSIEAGQQVNLSPRPDQLRFL